jgi:hypothetical protein
LIPSWAAPESLLQRLRLDKQEVDSSV